MGKTVPDPIFLAFRFLASRFEKLLNTNVISYSVIETVKMNEKFWKNIKNSLFDIAALNLFCYCAIINIKKLSKPLCVFRRVVFEQSSLHNVKWPCLSNQTPSLPSPLISLGHTYCLRIEKSRYVFIIIENSILLGDIFFSLQFFKQFFPNSLNCLIQSLNSMVIAHVDYFNSVFHIFHSICDYRSHHNFKI